jgi:thiamine-phosphate pyrophosphorylase
LSRIARPIACLITAGEAAADNYPDKKLEMIGLIETAAATGIGMVQVREKDLSARLLHDLVSSIAQITKATETLLIVNGRADIAAACGADGVHLPSDSIPTGAVRRGFPHLLIGVSTHSISEAEAAVSSGADYIFFGPVFETPGKGPSKGISALADVCSRLAPFPVIALGGIDETNFENAISSGASGVAAIRFLNNPVNFDLISAIFSKKPA